MCNSSGSDNLEIVLYARLYCLCSQEEPLSMTRTVQQWSEKKANISGFWLRVPAISDKF